MKRILALVIALNIANIQAHGSEKRQECARMKAELTNLRAQVKAAVSKIAKLEHDYALTSSLAANEEANQQKPYPAKSRRAAQ